MKMRIPFNKPFFSGDELVYIKKAVANGQISGNGPFTKKCAAFMEKRFGSPRVLLTTSCTSALEMAAILCNIKHGDDVIMPSFTFVSTANAFFIRGAMPVFVDIRPDTLNIDETKIEPAVTRRTKAVACVHYAGVACEMDAISRIARRRGLFVIEDAAHGLGARYKDRYLGTMGDLGAFSFHETKNCICGEGGALSINRKRFIGRAEVIWEKGTNRSAFFRGEVDKYSWIDIGSSYLPSDILAAFLYAQLEKIDVITSRRKEIYDRYHDGLSPLARKGFIRMPAVPAECSPSYHMFYLVLDDRGTMDALRRYLNARGIYAIFHYVPLHLSPVGRGFGYRRGDLPVTESLADRLLRLPFFFDLKPSGQDEVIKMIKRFFI